jgi:hypothetical protein
VTSASTIRRLAPQIRKAVPRWLREYGPGYTLFTYHQNDIVSEGITFFLNMNAPLDYAKLLREGFAQGLSHVISVETALYGIEATVGGVKQSELWKYFNDPEYICVVREPDGMTQTDLDMMLGFERAQIGSPYDYGVFPWFAVMSVTGLQDIFPSLRKKEPVGHRDGAYVCSALKAAGYFHTATYPSCDLFQKWNIYGIDPHRLFLEFPYKPFQFDKERRWIR